MVDRPLRRLRRVRWKLGSAGALAASHGEDQIGFYRKLTQHTAYDAFLAATRPMDKLLAARADSRVPTLLVHSLWDQEDIYGALAVYKALHAKDTCRRQTIPGDGPLASWPVEIDADTNLGEIGFGADTGLYFRQHILRPFLDHYLKDRRAADGCGAGQCAFESGTRPLAAAESLAAGLRGSSVPITATRRCICCRARACHQMRLRDADAASTYISDPAQSGAVHRSVPSTCWPMTRAMSWRNWLASRPARGKHAAGRADLHHGSPDRPAEDRRRSPSPGWWRASTGTDARFRGESDRRVSLTR